MSKKQEQVNLWQCIAYNERPLGPAPDNQIWRSFSQDQRNFSVPIRPSYPNFPDYPEPEFDESLLPGSELG
jgi:hypothetical protein